MSLLGRIVVSVAAFAAVIGSAHAHGRAHHRHAIHRVAEHVRHLRQRHHHPHAVGYAQAPYDSDSNPAYWQGESARGPVEAIGGDLVATARRFLGTGRQRGFPAEWCGAFMGLVARMTGHAVPAGYREAAQWIHAGPRLPGPRPGAVAVWSHHVGIIEAVTKQGPLLISGNFGHKVAEGYQRRGRLLGYVALAGRG